MKNEVTILVVEDDIGHATLLRKNLRRSGIINEIEHFKDGQQIMDFLSERAVSSQPKSMSYLLLLDIRMPKVDGIEVLKYIKENEKWKKLPVIMLTTTDSQEEINKCYEIGCSNYIVKPIDYENFIRSLQNLGLFLTVVEIPEI